MAHVPLVRALHRLKPSYFLSLLQMLACVPFLTLTSLVAQEIRIWAPREGWPRGGEFCFFVVLLTHSFQLYCHRGKRVQLVPSWAAASGPAGVPLVTWYLLRLHILKGANSGLPDRVESH